MLGPQRIDPGGYMSRSRKKRRGRLAALFVLLAAAAPAQAGQYRVGLAGMVILPAEAPNAAGSERRLMPGDTVMRAPLGWFHTAAIAEDVTVEIAGVSETITPLSQLWAVISRRGGDLSSLAEGAPIFCGELRTNAVAAVASSLTLGLSSVATRVARQRRFCLVDSDSDGRFDRAFLVGAKRAPDQIMVPITPVAYREARNVPIGEGNHIEIGYSGGGLLGSANFPVGFYVGGVRQPIDLMLTGDGRGIVRTSAAPNFRSRRIPMAVTIGSAQVTVLAFDSQSKGATIRYDRDFQWTPVSVSYRPQTIYVYVPG